MTSFNLGAITSSLHTRSRIDRLDISGRDTGTFKPDRRTWRWHPSLSGDLDELPVVAMLPATSIAATSVILNATGDPRGLSGSIVFDYGTAVDTSGRPVFGRTTTPQTLTPGYGGQAVSLVATGLTANTLYYARARASNSVGETASSFVTFQTSVDAAPSGPPIPDTDLRLVGPPGQTTVTLTTSWNMNGAAGLIHIEQQTSGAWVDITPPLATSTGVTTMTATATSLTPGTSYTFRTRASNPNSPEPGVTGNSVTTTTAPPDPTLPVATLLPAGTPTLTSEVVNARITKVIEVPVRYQFQYGLTTSYGSSTPLQIDTVLPPGGTEDVTATITGLSPDTTYHYRLMVMRNDAAGGNQFSLDGTFTTPTPPPTVPVPTIQPADTLTSSSSVLHGRVDNIVGVPAKYQFEYGLTTAYGSITPLVTDTVIPVGGGEAVQATITGLAASTTYHYRLKATRTDDAGGVQNSADGTFTTTAAPAAILPVVSPKGPVTVGQTTAILNGIVGQITNQSAINYHFEYGATTSYGTNTSVGSITPLGGGAASLAGMLVSGSVDPQGATLTLWIDYGTDPDNLNQSAQYGQIAGTGAKSFAMLVDNLTANTIYWFRARATNSGGTSVSTMRPTRGRTPLATPEVAYYISPTGNNTTGDGSSGNPWKTIQKAISTPGVTTVLMKTGLYVGQTPTARPSSLVTIKDAGDGPVEIDFVTITAPCGNLNFEGNIKVTGYSRPDLQSTLVFQGTGDGSGAKAGPIYWAAGNITLIGKTSAAVCIRASSDADNFYFDGVQTQGGGFGVKGFTGTTPTSSYPTGWRFTGCNFGPDHTWDCVHLGSAKNWRFIACDEHDPKSLGGYVFGNTTEEHHDGVQVQYADDIKWVGGRVYDHTNPAVTSPGSAILLNADTAGGVVSNHKYIGRVIENWSGGGINLTNGATLKFIQVTIGSVTGTGDGTHPASTGSTADVSVDAAPTDVTFRGVNAREQFVNASAAVFTANDKNLWRSSATRAGTSSKSGAVTFVSTTDLHLANSTQAAATGGPVPTDDADVLAWDNDGRGYGSNPAIGAYASPSVTSPLFSGMVTATPTIPEAQEPATSISSLTAGTTYHYRVSAVRADGSGGTQNGTDATFTTQSATLVTTPAAYGPATAVTTTSTVAGGIFVVKSDGKIYDSTGTTLQDFTSKAFNTLVTIKSDTAGTRRALNAGLLNNSQYQAGLVLTELAFNDPAANFEVKDPVTTYGVDVQGCSGRLGHFRVVNYAHNGVRLSASAASITNGSTASTWSVSTPDLRLDNFTTHGNNPDGVGILVVKGRNVVFGGCDLGGHYSSPTGLGGSSTVPGCVKYEGATSADEVQDCYVGIALDGTPAIHNAKPSAYREWIGSNSRRCGWEGILGNEVLFANTTGSRPEKPAWLGVSGGAVPGTETAVNTTAALVTVDNPRTRNGVALNLVTFTFRNGATGNQAFEVDASVYDPAALLTDWSDTTAKFIDPKSGLGARPTSATPPALQNKTTVTSSFTLPVGATGTVSRSGDNWLEIRGVKFDPGTFATPIWTDGTGAAAKLFVTDTSKGSQLVVAPAASQPGGVIPDIPLYTGPTTPATLPTGGATLKVTKPSGSAPDFTGWPTTPATNSDPTKQKLDEHLLGIYTNYNDPALGNNAVETGTGYRRQLGYTGIDTTLGAFTGVFLIGGPSGGAINPNPGDVLSVSAATPGVVTTFFPHGLATNDWVSITGNTQAAANGTFKATRLTATTFSLQTTAGVNVTIPAIGTGGTYTPLGPGGTGYTYGLSGTVTALTGANKIPAGATLDMTQNDNLGQPAHNAQLLIGADTGNGVRFVGCDFFNVSIQAVDTTIKCQLVDCQSYASNLPGQGIDFDTVDNGVRGTYDPSNQHMPAHVIGALNMIAPGEAFWVIERSLFHNAHGDVMPGRYQLGSTLRHSHIHHSRDGGNTAVTGSIMRDAVPPFSGFPKVAQGPHGDQFQNYDRNNITVIGCDLHSDGNNSIFFTQNLLNYAVFTAGGKYNVPPGNPDPLTITSDGGTPAKIVVNISTKTVGTKENQFHNFGPGDKMRIDNSGDGALDGKEFVVTNTAKGTVNIDAPYTGNRSGFTATHVIHQTSDWRRNDMRVTRNWNRSDLTEQTSLTGLGNKTFSSSNAGVANLVTMNLTFLDNRFDTGSPGGSSGWVLPVIVAGSTYNFGTPNRNLWRNYEANQGFVPGGVATPKN